MGGSGGTSQRRWARASVMCAVAVIVASAVVTTPAAGDQGDVDVPFGVNGMTVVRGGTQSASLADIYLALTDTGVIAVAGSMGSVDDSVVTLNPAGGIASVLSDELGRVADVDTTVDGRTLAASTIGVHRWLPDGSADAAFGAGGTVNLAAGPCACSIDAIAVDALGRVVVVARRGNVQVVVARLLTNGLLDPSFAGDGISDEIPSGLGFYKTMAVAPDGAIVIHIDGPQSDVLVAVNANGSLRAGFGTDGVLTLPEAIPQLVGTDDGGLYVIAALGATAGIPIRRLQPGTGATDTAWGTAGVATIVTDNPSGTMVHGSPVFSSVSAHGPVVTVGYTVAAGPGQQSVYLTTFDTAALAPQSGFGATDPAGPGIVTVLAGERYGSVRDVTTSADGIVNLAYGESDGWRIQRRNTDGSLRTTFGTGGAQPLTLPRHVQTDAKNVVRATDGDLLSSFYDGSGQIVRHSATGTLRSGWGQNGRFSVARHFVVDHDPLTDGRLAVLVYDRANEVNELLILSASGALDTTLGTDGFVPVFGHQIDVAGTPADPQVITTSSMSSPTVTFRAYDPDTGALIPSYGDGGSKSVATGGISSVATAVAPDGSLWWAFAPSHGNAVLEVRRMTAAGQPDGGFGDAGVAAVPPSNVYASGAQIHFHNGLGYVSTGLKFGDTFYGLVARLTAQGRVDPTYAGGLAVTPPLEGAHGGVSALDDGRVTFLVSGGGGMRLARLDATGAPDETLGYGGITWLSSTSPSIRGTSLVVDNAGVVVLGTVPTSYPGELPGTDAALARFRTGGPSRAGQPLMIAPRRLLHTSGPTSDNQYSFAGALVPGAPRVLPVDFRIAVPGGPSTAILNVTTMQSSSNGYLTVGPCDETPSGATVTFTADGPVSNEVIVPLTWSAPYFGAVCIWTSATTQAVIDAVGGHPLGTSYRAMASTRYWDTRSGSTTFDGAYQGTGRLSATAAPLPIPIGGRGPLPSNAEAAVLNVTAIRPASNGYLTVGLCDQPAPNAATLTYQSLRTISNEVVVALPTSGRGSGQICVFTSAATDVTVDVVGWFEGSSALRSWVPRRAVNSLAGGVTDDGLESGEGRLTAGVQRSMRIAGRAGVPAEGGLVVMNITAVRPGANGYLVAHPCDEPVPPTASLVFGRRTVSSELIVSVPPASQMTDGLCVTASTNVDVVIDVSGSFPA